MEKMNEGQVDAEYCEMHLLAGGSKIQSHLLKCIVCFCDLGVLLLVI